MSYGSTYLNNLDQLRQVEWASSYLWDLKIEGAPPPFDSWFPALEVRENLFSLRTFDFDAGMTNIRLPQGTSVFDLNITFIDNEEHAITNWLKKWVNESILGNGEYVQTISECCKTVHILKFTRDRKKLSHQAYLIYPVDSLYFEGSSQSDVLQMSVQYVIAGTIVNSGSR